MLFIYLAWNTVCPPSIVEHGIQDTTTKICKCLYCDLAFLLQYQPSFPFFQRKFKKFDMAELVHGKEGKLNVWYSSSNISMNALNSNMAFLTIYITRPMMLGSMDMLKKSTNMITHKFLINATESLDISYYVNWVINICSLNGL